MKETNQIMTKLTSVQAYALQVKADRKAAAFDRRSGAIAGDNARIKEMFTFESNRKEVKVKRANSKKVRWTSAEFDLLIELYLKHADAANSFDNRYAIVDDFTLQFPERGQYSIILGVMQIKALDSYFLVGGMKDSSQELINKLFAVDSVRFPGAASKEEKISDALDALLADVRNN